jgi:hypothetical protein
MSIGSGLSDQGFSNRQYQLVQQKGSSLYKKNRTLVAFRTVHAHITMEAFGLLNRPNPSIATFPLGRIVVSLNAIANLTRDEIIAAIQRHQSGDWGDVSEEDRKENELSLQRCFRLLSVFRSARGVTFWIITQSDRRVTKILLPEDA